MGSHTFKLENKTRFVYDWIKLDVKINFLVINLKQTQFKCTKREQKLKKRKELNANLNQPFMTLIKVTSASRLTPTNTNIFVIDYFETNDLS